VMKVALVGQPNCGKSTLFNRVSGYKAVVSNYPGTTIDFNTSRVGLEGEAFELVDIPGIYALSSSEKDELLTRNHLFNLYPDVIINIMDASLLGRSLELTLELLELRVPLVVCLNMMDEAERKGIQIDVEHLERELAVPVIPTVASQGQGVQELFMASIETSKKRKIGKSHPLSLDVEMRVAELAMCLGEAIPKKLGLPRRLIALKLLEEDEDLEEKIRGIRPELIPKLQDLRHALSQSHGRPSDMVLSSERHSLAMNLFEHVALVKPAEKKMFRDVVDRYLMHPLWGYLFLGMVLFVLFNFVFTFGSLVEQPLLGWFDRLTEYVAAHLTKGSLLFTLAHGIIQGLSGGIGIVLPYLIPFLFGLTLLEDIGYLPRVAFLMDALMHRIGLHGKAIIPFVLGYGCTVPALMGVKIMDSSRDRFLAGVLVNFIPCAARTTVIFALVAYYLGPNFAALLYIMNIVVIAVAGSLLSRLQPEVSPGMILEIPAYRLPSLQAIAHKIWYRLREFIVIAWPLLIAGSVILSLIEYFHFFETINRFLSPFTSGVLGLPERVSVTLIFGILRKELTVIMLVEALGTTDFASIMTQGQLMVFTIFTIFYIPCLASLAMLRKVIGPKGMLFALVFTTAVATILAVLCRIIFALFV
jgi:ferrous iron transport protein B